MEINKYIKAVNTYSKTTLDSTAKIKHFQTTKNKNVDKTDFSSIPKNNTDASVDALKKSITKQVDSIRATTQSPEKISALKSLIANGQYNVSAKNIADSIINNK